MLLRFLVLSGAPPADLVNREKVRELTNVVEHMHQREDQYRRKLQELQEEIDVRQREKKKVLVKLQRARGELVNYQEHLETVQQDTQQVRVQARPSSWGVHASCLLAALCVTWFSYQDYPALERKLAATICFPVFWIWVASLAASTPNHRITAVLYCTCWFLIGFVSCHKFHIC
ncbi:hypothetical protein WJX72_004609 [[Myrmecia] bisecta]|uniref:Uncharacterized protein n=1 Tax=[Myrmecia] bisecta TaxID=41462 RepID=A0AAW1PTM0_9CHLO